MIGFIIALLFFTTLLFLAHRLNSFKREGFDETIDYIEYHPPTEINSLHAGYLVDGKLDSKDIFSLIVLFFKEKIIFFEKKRTSFLGYKHKILVNKFSKDSPCFKKYKFFFSTDLFSENNYFNLFITEKNINRSKKYLELDLVNLGYLDKDFVFKTPIAVSLFIFIVVIVIYFIIINPLSWDLGGLYKSLYIVIILIPIFFKKQVNFSKKGLKIRRELKGFKEYLKVVEKPRVEFFLKELNTPEEKIDKIKHLEYFIAFGLISIEDILS